MKAIILSAGKGTRLRPLTATTPKPLLPINGQCLIEYHIKALVKAGINEIIINVSHLADTIIEIIGDGSRYNATIHYSIEETPLETGGGILKALKWLGDQPFIAVSADIFTDFDFSTLTTTPIKLAHLVLTDNPPFNPKGDFALEDNLIRNTGKHCYNFAGISVIAPELLKNHTPGKFSISPLLREAINKEQVTGEYFNGIWYNIGTKAIYQQVQQLFETTF